MRYASYGKQEAARRGREFLSLLNQALIAEGFPQLKPYTDREASAISMYSLMSKPKVIDFGGGRGQLVSSINGSRATRGLIFTKQTRVAGL